MKGMVLFALAMLLATSPCYADNDVSIGTGNQLIQWCNDTTVNDTDTSNLGLQICMGYINGIIEGMDLGAGLVVMHYRHTKLANVEIAHPNDGLDFCLPTNITIGQEARVVAKYLKDHPADLNLQSWSLVYLAIKDAWPCASKK